MNCNFSRVFVICVVCTFLMTVEIGAEEPREVVHPRDTGEALINPDMGWTLHFYSNIIANYGSKLEPSDTVDDFPGLSVVYLRVPWAFLEPREGEFNWALLDTPAQRWIAKGKKIALRVTCSESWMRYATPEWVKNAGAKGVDFNFGKGPAPDGKLWDPDYLDPIFLQKLDKFLAVMARRYDGNPNVAFIDVGGRRRDYRGKTGTLPSGPGQANPARKNRHSCPGPGGNIPDPAHHFALQRLSIETAFARDDPVRAAHRFLKPTGRRNRLDARNQARAEERHRAAAEATRRTRSRQFGNIHSHRPRNQTGQMPQPVFEGLDHGRSRPLLRPENPRRALGTA